MSNNTKIQEISLGDDFGDVAVKANGIRIEIHADGSFNVKNLSAAANASPSPRAGENPVRPDTPAPEIGHTMLDDMKYAGISPDTGKAFYVDQADAPGFYTFYQARDYAESYGKRLPTKAELNVLFNNKAAIAGFNETGSVNAGWYWSFSRGYSNAGWAAQRFSDGAQGNFNPRIPSSLRLVRD